MPHALIAVANELAFGAGAMPLSSRWDVSLAEGTPLAEARIEVDPVSSSGGARTDEGNLVPASY